MNPLDVYGWFYGLPIPAEFDNLKIAYLNPKKGSKVAYELKNYKMYVNEFDEKDFGKESYFESHLPQ